MICFYYNHRPHRHLLEISSIYNTATIDLCLTYCKLRRQLFAWKTAFHDMSIDKDEWQIRIHPIRQLSFIGPWSGHNALGPNVTIDGDSIYSTETNVYWLLPYAVVSAEMWSLKQFCMDLHCNAVSHQLYFTKWDSLRCLFSLITQRRPTPWYLLLVSLSFMYFAYKY